MTKNMPIDYSKWKQIDVSDDEDETHPNIDTPSLFRWRHQARLERMAEKKQQKEELEKNKSVISTKMTEIEDKLKDTNIAEDERKKLEAEKGEILKQEEEWRRKEEELAEKERLEPWNVDTIGHEGVNKSRINKIGEKKPQQPTIDDEEDSKRMYKYFETNEDRLRELSRLNGLEESEQYLLEHPLLATEYSSNWLTIEALNIAIEEKDDVMCGVAEQCIIVQYLLQLAKSLVAEPTNTNFIKNFFKKFKSADESYMKLFKEEVTAFQDRLRTRAKQKRDEALAEYEAEEKVKRVNASPGGLDPQEVYESLPAEMKAAFDSQEVSKLQEVASKMDHEVFGYHLQRCIDSGLWVPNANASEGDAEEEDDHLSQPSTSNSA